jgi:hypothetical protein
LPWPSASRPDGRQIGTRKVLFAGWDAGAVPRASSDHYEFLPGADRQSAQRFLSSVLENQGNGLAKVRQTLLARLALPIGARHFSALRDITWAVSLDDRREFVARFFVLPLPAPGVASAEKAQHVGDEENQQYGPQPYAGASTVTPAAVAVVPPTAT